MASKKAASKGATKRAGGGRKAGTLGAKKAGTKRAAAKKPAAQRGSTWSAAKKGATKKGAAERGAAKKGAAKKGAAKKGTTERSLFGTTVKCGNWRAIINRMPGPLPPALNVTGQCRVPTTGWTITLKPANPQGTNPRVLLLRKTVTPPAGPVIQIPQTVEVRYRQPATINYTHVTILPDNVTVAVQTAF